MNSYAAAATFSGSTSVRAGAAGPIKGRQCGAGTPASMQPHPGAGPSATRVREHSDRFFQRVVVIGGQQHGRAVRIAGDLNALLRGHLLAHRGRSDRRTRLNPSC